MSRKAPRIRSKTEANAVKAQAFAERLRPELAELEGLTDGAAARELARRGHATARGGRWSALTVERIRRRLRASP